MEVSGARDSSQNEKEADACIESEADDTEEQGLAQRAAKGKSISNEVELANLVMVSLLWNGDSMDGMENLPWWTVASSDGYCR